MAKNLFAFCLLFSLAGFSQPVKYTVSNIHAHNDYDYNVPFTQAYALQLGSIEADVFWVNDTLFVAHKINELKRNILFESSYLQKLACGVKANKGRAYADKSMVLQLLIDIKTDSLQTLDAVIRNIRKFHVLVRNHSVHFVITGNQTPAEQFTHYPSYILFDGKLHDPSHLKQLKRIRLFSANFANYSKWKGLGEIPPNDLTVLKNDIALAHSLHKPIRFWGVPDNPHTWKIMMQLGVDYINTDHIADVARFVESSLANK